MENRKLVILDTETTGMQKEIEGGYYITEDEAVFFNQNETVKHRVNQLAYIVAGEVEGGLETLEVFDEMCLPPVISSVGAVATTGITPEMLIGKPAFAELDSAKRLNELNTNENVFIAHNLPFDREMLSREGFKNQMPIIDTLRVLMHVFPNLESHSMQWYRYGFKLYLKEPEAIKEVGKEISAHDALGDVIVLKLLVEDLIEKGISIDEQIRLSQLPCMLTKLKFGKYRGKQLTEIAVEDAGYILYMLSTQYELPVSDRNIDMVHTFETLVNQFNLYLNVSFKFGKYKGMAVHEVMQKDKGYIDWLLSTVEDNIAQGKKVTTPQDILMVIEHYSNAN